MTIHDPIDLERVGRILAPLCADPSSLAITFEAPDGRYLAGSSGSASGRGRTRLDRDVHVEGVRIGRLVARGDAAASADIAGILESLAIALGALIGESRARRTLEESLQTSTEAAHHSLDADFAHGRQQQRRIVTFELPDVDGYDLASHYEAARDVGGDFYELFRVQRRGSPLGIVIADVTGKGIAAALLMAFARPVIHGAMDLAAGPAEALERTNRILVDEGRSTLFITAVAARLDTGGGHLRLANAGHEEPLLIPADGSAIRPVGEAGVLLGAFSSLGLKDQRIRMARGDVVFFYTDGVTDALGPGGDRFGDDRLLSTLEAARGGTAHDVVSAVRDAVTGFCTSVEAADDVTIVAVGRQPS